MTGLEEDAQVLPPGPWRAPGVMAAAATASSRPSGSGCVTTGRDEERDRDDIHEYVIEHLGEPEAVLIIEETADLTRGRLRLSFEVP